MSANAIAGGASCRCEWCCLVLVHASVRSWCARVAGSGPSAGCAVEGHEHAAGTCRAAVSSDGQQADGPQQRVAARERAEQDFVLAEEPRERRDAGDRDARR